MRALRLQNPAGVFGDLSAFVPRFAPATTSPTLVVETSWAGDDAAPGPSAGHMRISFDGGPAKDIPFPTDATAEAMNAIFVEYGIDARVHVQTVEERAEEKRLAEEAARPENVKARWLKQVEGLTDEELETVLDGFGVFTRERKRAAKRFGVRRFFQVGLTPEETARAQSFIRLDLYASEDD